MSYFSSKGPTSDGRIKPDISVMGENIWSANSRSNRDTGHCSMAVKSGTSMATPLAASAAGIIVQYFMDGYYINGKKNINNGIKPSANLIKAMMIHSGENLLGEVDRNDNIESFKEWPNNKQGFGAISLDRVLYFEDDPHFRLKVFEDTILKNGEDKTYQFYYNSSIMFKATLTWLDPPVDIRSTKMLLNDLDLIININNTEFYSNGLKDNDHLNNVEVILLPANLYPLDERMLLTITIKKYDISTYSQVFNILNLQNYSLVITGDFYDNLDDKTIHYNPLSDPVIVTDPISQNVISNVNDIISKSNNFAQYIPFIVIGVCLLILIIVLSVVLTVVYKRNKVNKKPKVKEPEGETFIPGISDLPDISTIQTHIEGISNLKDIETINTPNKPQLEEQNDNNTIIINTINQDNPNQNQNSNPNPNPNEIIQI